MSRDEQDEEELQDEPEESTAPVVREEDNGAIQRTTPLSQGGLVVRDELEDAIRRAAPRWNECDICKGSTSGRRCFDCQQRQDRLGEARERTMDSIPELFRWAHLRAPELIERVAGGLSTIARATAAVGASRVLIIGKSGMGKTSLVAAMMRARTEEDAAPCVFVLATDLATARSRQKLGSESPEILAAMKAKLLVIDDLGTDALIPTSAVTEVIFHRHAHMKPTWVTTWMSEEQLSTRYGDGLVRRLIEGARIIDCGLPSVS